MFYVEILHYSLEPGAIGTDNRLALRFPHRTAKAAARRLASLISGKQAKAARRAVPQGRGMRCGCIEPVTGEFVSLNELRRRFA